jgi:nucleotide-binding universal stress UspA family protein
MEDEAENTFKAMVAALPEPSPKVSFEIEIGDVLQVIKETVKEKAIDLVVMGTTGSTGLMHFLIGSNTEKVVRNIPVPVLAVERADFVHSVKSILLPSTLGLDQTHFMDKVKGLQEFFKATLHILYVNTPRHFKRDGDAYRAMEEFVRHYHLNNFEMHFVNDYTEEGGIVDFAVNQKMDLIAMGTHARKGLSHLFNANITEHVVYQLRAAVWTCTLKIKN